MRVACAEALMFAVDKHSSWSSLIIWSMMESVNDRVPRTQAPPRTLLTRAHNGFLLLLTLLSLLLTPIAWHRLSNVFRRADHLRAGRRDGGLAGGKFYRFTVSSGAPVLDLISLSFDIVNNMVILKLTAPSKTGDTT
jgi:hypothetical protein